MASMKNDYFDCGRVVSLILGIIPVTSFLCGVITRFQEKCYVAGILRLFLGWNIIYIVDLILLIVKGKIWRLLNI